MSNLKEVVKKTLLRLQKEGQIATPDAYREAFCYEAKSAGLSVEDCQWQSRWSQKFDPKTKAQIQAHPIKTPDEFISLIAGILTRMGSGENKESILAQKELLKVILKLLASSPEVAELAKETLLKLDSLSDSKVLSTLKDRWNEALKNQLERHDPSRDFAKILEPFLTPSLSPLLPSEILEAKSLLKNAPATLLEKGARQTLDLALSGRIAADRRESNRKGLELGEIIEVLVSKLSTLAQAGIHYQDEITHIGKTLEEMILDPRSLEKTKSRLIEITQKIDTHIQNLNKEVAEKKSEIEFLQSKIEELTQELCRAQEEASIDSLTGVHTRRFLEESLNRFEALFLRYESRYSVAFFDIDFFKKINDKYGHEAGDRVLATFGRLLKQSVRQEDIAARYGGEEFIVILPEMNLAEAWRFAERIRALVERSVFVYQDMRIKVSVSGGIAERSECEDRKALIKFADARLYEAKEGGRNQIRPLLS